jgi:ABC-type uncharacterized transport system ATPase subunit
MERAAGGAAGPGAAATATLDPSARAGDLSVALKQRLEILKALAGDATILLLDEPTAVLAPAEADEVLALVRRFAAGGASVVLITHKLEEALRAADQVTVLRSGRVTLTGRAADQTAPGLAAAMIGAADLGPRPLRRTTVAAGGPVRVRCVALDLLREDGHGLAISDAQFEIGAGEVLGVAAIEGNGHRELLRAMAGLVRPLRGRLDLQGPVAFIPEDRTTEGLIPDLDLTQNVVLGVGRAAPWVRRWRLDWGSARERTEALIREFGIHSPSADVAAGALSGGNQQKLVVARALEILPRVIIAENPTRGLDVHAGRAVWQRLEAATRDGAALIVYSTDLDELLGQATRVLVVVNGRLTRAPVSAGRNEIGEMMLGARPGEAP